MPELSHEIVLIVDLVLDCLGFPLHISCGCKPHVGTLSLSG